MTSRSGRTDMRLTGWGRTAPSVAERDCERPVDRGPHVLSRHDPRLRTPLGQKTRFDIRADVDGALPVPLQQASGDQFGAAVVVRHIESVKPGTQIRRHGVGGMFRVEQIPVPLHIGDLPQTGDDGADFKAGAQHTLI